MQSSERYELADLHVAGIALIGIVFIVIILCIIALPRILRICCQQRSLAFLVDILLVGIYTR